MPLEKSGVCLPASQRQLGGAKGWFGVDHPGRASARGSWVSVCPPRSDNVRVHTLKCGRCIGMRRCHRGRCLVSPRNRTAIRAHLAVGAARTVDHCRHDRRAGMARLLREGQGIKSHLGCAAVGNPAGPGLPVRPWSVRTWVDAAGYGISYPPTGFGSTGQSPVVAERRANARPAFVETVGPM